MGAPSPSLFTQTLAAAHHAPRACLSLSSNPSRRVEYMRMAGPGGRRGGRSRGRGRRGRGRRGGATTTRRAPSPTPSSSSQDAVCFFEFLLRIDDDPLGIKRLPDKFAELVDGDELDRLQLREASCASCYWPVDVLFDGQGKMYMYTGWDKFAISHNLAAGCLLTFLYEGDGDMVVKVFDETSCRRHYHTDDSGDDTDA